MAGNTKGLTLVEVMATAAIIAVIAAPISFVLSTGYRNYYIERDTMEAREKARICMEGIMADLMTHDGRDIVVVDGRLVVEPSSIVYIGYGREIRRTNPSDSSWTTVCTDVERFIVTENNDFDSRLIEVEIGTRVGKGKGISLKNTYRIKSE